MNEVQLRPLLLALATSLFCLYALVIVWPRYVPPPPAPFVEGLLSEIRAQNFEVVYSHLAERWPGPKSVLDFVNDNLRDEELTVHMGGFLESTWIDLEKVEQKGPEAWVPVFYRMKIANPPREYVREVMIKLVYERARWRLDSLKVLKS